MVSIPVRRVDGAEKHQVQTAAAEAVDLHPFSSHEHHSTPPPTAESDTYYLFFHQVPFSPTVSLFINNHF